MTTISDADNTLLRNLREISARQRISSPITDLLEQYFAKADVASLDEASPEELHGAALQHYRLGAARAAKQTEVVIYTPDFDRHGWHSPHTVVDIVTDNMPYLVDSITMAVNKRNLTIHRLMHPLIGIERDASGALKRSVVLGSEGTTTESWIHLEIDRISDEKQVEDFRAEIVAIFDDVRAAYEDRAAMSEGINKAIADLEVSKNDENSEVSDFLRWVAAENFVFLGYAHYEADKASGKIKRAIDGGLGILRRADHPVFGQCLNGIPASLEEIARMPSALTLVKADARSTVHRRTYLDFIGVHHRDAKGNVIGEHVFVGIYGMNIQHTSVNEIPLVRNKVATVRTACAFASGSFRDKGMGHVLETYPREELIEIGTDDLMRIAKGIVMLQEHPRVRVFLRNDAWGRYVSAFVFMPRDRFDSSVRRRIVTLLSDSLKSDSIDFFVTLSESRLARLHLVARMPAGTHYDYDAEAFEHEVARIVRGWHDEVQHNLIEHCGEARGNELVRRYATALPIAYQDQVPPSSAVSDLECLAAAEKSGRVEVKLNAPYGDDGSHQHIKLFLSGNPRPLSTVLPVFENLGITVLSEQPFKLSDSKLHIADFAVQLPRANALDAEPIRKSFVDLLEKLLREEAENDGFNRLALLAGLDNTRVTILRAYGHYLRQAGLPFSLVYIERCLASHPLIAGLLVDLFIARLSPEGNDEHAAASGT